MGAARRWTIVVAALALAACSGSGGGKAPVTTVPPRSTPAWNRADLKPVTQPVVAGGLFVLYVAVPGGLGMVGLDPATGRSVWQVPASRAFTTPGVAPSVQVVGGSVLLYQAAPKLDQLVALDPGSGARRWATQPTAFTGWPDRCVDDPAAVCTAGILPGRRGNALRFAADSGRALPSPVISPEAGRELGTNLYDSGLRDPELLVGTDGARVAWKQPLATIFTGPGLSTDNGWNLERIPAVGLFVGSVDGPPVRESATESAHDLANAMTAGFRIADGTPVWRDAGTRYVCSILPCPGTGQPAQGTTDGGDATLGLRIRATGTSVAGPSIPPRLEPGAKVRLEGFDLATGTTTWSFEAGASNEIVFGGSVPQVGPDSLILAGPDAKPTEVDLKTGSRQPARPGTTGWCHKTATYEGKPVKMASGRTLTSFEGGAMRFPCDVVGKPAPPPVFVPPFVGPVSGVTMAWSEADKVVAVRGPS